MHLSEACRGIWGHFPKTMEPCQKEKLEVKKKIIVILSLEKHKMGRNKHTWGLLWWSSG